MPLNAYIETSQDVLGAEVSGVQSESMRVLVIEDDAEAAAFLVKALKESGHVADHVSDGESGLALAETESHDVLIVDRMLPKRDGLSLISSLRAAGIQTPALILSALGEVDDRVKGLRAGGDDYLAKPFHLPEFLLRVRALLRRAGRGGPADRVAFGGHEVDLRSWTAVLADGRSETLGEREVGLLRVLASRPGEVVSRDDILDAVWGNDAFPSSRTVDNVVLRLRKTFEPDPSAPRFLHTVWGVGYRFTPEGESP